MIGFARKTLRAFRNISPEFLTIQMVYRPKNKPLTLCLIRRECYTGATH